MVKLNESPESLSELFEDRFPLITESAILVWRWVRVGLSYKYEISTIIEDAVAMCVMVHGNESGHEHVHWPSSSFRATWELKWSNGTIVVDASWEAIAGRVERLLQDAGSVRISVTDFLAEWNEIFRVLVAAVPDGIDVDEVQGLRELLDLNLKLNELPRGVIYRGVSPT